MGLWGTFTGEDDVRVAKEKLEYLRGKIELKKIGYGQQEIYVKNEFENLINIINTRKLYIKNVLLPKLIKILSKIKYDDSIQYENYNIYNLNDINNKFEQLLHKDNLIQIDFDKNPVRATLLAIITLGIVTRKDAEESLTRVMNLERIFKYQCFVMDFELDKIRNLNRVLKQYLEYFDKMIIIYEKVILKSENTLKYLQFKFFQFTFSIKKERIKLSYLPKADQNLLFALFNLSDILYKMANLMLVDDKISDRFTNNPDKLNKENVEELYKQFMNKNKAA